MRVKALKDGQVRRSSLQKIMNNEESRTSRAQTSSILRHIGEKDPSEHDN